MLRLAVSAGLAFALVALVISVGTRFLQGPPPDAGTTGAVGAPDAAATGLPLRFSDQPARSRVTERDVAALREFLTLTPRDRLDRALAESDTRFLGINGFVVDVPGIGDPLRALREDRVRVMPGTTDSFLSAEHAELVGRGRRYATAYNALLLRHAAETPTRSGAVP